MSTVFMGNSHYGVGRGVIYGGGGCHLVDYRCLSWKPYEIGPHH